ncbi:helix-turn-helix domain-containing protein [Anaerotignum sp.]|uniref:helix-turn-helix domain-containing protein n=1 Tax=Anaerotignum sp. TaxID=2039241 RepID=UPI00289A349E|nr:XRE family transcriptional regulator [Anaerotignum sp.]
MNSVERVKAICKERKIPISKLEKDLGFANGYIGQLKKGSFPDDRLLAIASHLGVTVDYLMNGEETKQAEKFTLTDRDKKDIAKDMEAIRKKLSSKEDGPASFDGEDIEEAEVELVLDSIEMMLKRLKRINKEKYNPNKNKDKK